MSSFFEKLKKGMDIKALPNIEETKDLPDEKSSVQSLPFKKVDMKEKQKKTEKVKKEEEFKPPTTFVPKVVEGKKKKIYPVKSREAGISPKAKLFNRVKVKKEKGKIEEKKTEMKKEKKWFEPEGQLVIDVYQTNEEIVIQSAIAGVKPEDLDISIENDMVTIRGDRKKPLEPDERNYFYQECHWGRFSRKIILPAEVDGARTRAIMKEGILTIRIPKIEREKKRKITIKE